MATPVRNSWLKPAGLVMAGAALALAGFFAGRLSQGSSPYAAVPAGVARPVQFQLPPQGPPDQGAQELIPLPGPGQGQQPQQQPGQGQQPQECPIFIYQDGRLYQLPRPGQQPQQQQQPGPGNGPFPGQPGGSPELIPLDPTLPAPTPEPAPSQPQQNNRI